MTASDLKFELETADRTIIDRTEFTRLIRKLRFVRIAVFVGDYQRDKIVAGVGGTCIIAKLPAKQALDQLESGSFDVYVWEMRDGALWISHEVAPARLQIQRTREIINAEIAKLQQRLSMDFVQSDADYRDRLRRYLATAQSKLARLEAHTLSSAA